MHALIALMPVWLPMAALFPVLAVLVGWVAFAERGES